TRSVDRNCPAGWLACHTVGDGPRGEPSFTRVVHTGRFGHFNCHCHSFVLVVWGLDGSGRVPRGDGRGAVSREPSSGRRCTAHARCVRRAVLRIGGDAL